MITTLLGKLSLLSYQKTFLFFPNSIDLKHITTHSVTDQSPNQFAEPRDLQLW